MIAGTVSASIAAGVGVERFDFHFEAGVGRSDHRVAEAFVVLDPVFPAAGRDPEAVDEDDRVGAAGAGSEFELGADVSVCRCRCRVVGCRIGVELLVLCRCCSCAFVFMAGSFRRCDAVLASLGRTHCALVGRRPPGHPRRRSGHDRCGRPGSIDGLGTVPCTTTVTPMYLADPGRTSVEVVATEPQPMIASWRSRQRSARKHQTFADREHLRVTG